MNISIQCPICRKMFSGKESLEGKTVPCPGCKEPFTIRRFSPEDAAWDSVQRPQNDLVAMAMEEHASPRQTATLKPKVFPNGKFCSTCGASIHARAETCTHCGVRQSGASGTKSRIVACVLAIFLGGLGLHKFYLGHNGTGLVYLLISVLGLPLVFPPLVMGIISLIEGVGYLATADDDRFTAEYAAKS